MKHELSLSYLNKESQSFLLFSVATKCATYVHLCFLFSGGTLKIYGDHLRPDLPYKTLLLSTADTAAYVVKETLEKYGMEKEDPTQFCLVQVGFILYIISHILTLGKGVLERSHICLTDMI